MFLESQWNRGSGEGDKRSAADKSVKPEDMAMILPYAPQIKVANERLEPARIDLSAIDHISAHRRHCTTKVVREVLAVLASALPRNFHCASQPTSMVFINVGKAKMKNESTVPKVQVNSRKLRR